MRIACVVLAFAVLTACSSEGPESAVGSTDVAAASAAPNILFIVVDDLGFTDLGAFGSEIPTPNIDRLAYDGLRLTNLHTAANCQSTRLMFMSGTSIANALERYPRSAERPPGIRSTHLSLGWATMAELLQDAGYQTYMTGKWDLGGLEHSPARRGFDRSFALLGASTNYFGTDQRPVSFEDEG
ncbi:MAG: sulfatase-like hydrolase/transferase, partial [Candidatus Rariloculaceae bacterium]